jgi:RNA repair pathway DNA polymerase beta family
LKRMEAFDLDRMAEYESLTTQITDAGPVKEVLEADPEKMAYISRHWSIELPVLQRFRKLHREHFSGYMGEKRKNMVRRYQYDVKNAAHLIRLLRMGAEFVDTGTLQVYRTHDADELKRIKRGGWTLDQVKAEAERLSSLMEPARTRSPLQAEPNAIAADALLQRIHLHFLGLSLPG